MTSVTGTFTYCGFGKEPAIDLSCTGTACDALQGFPNTTCTTSGPAVTCTNGVKCETALWITDLSFDLADTPSALVQQKHITTIPECNYRFEVTSDGKPSGLVFRNLTSPDPQCNTPIGGSSNSSVPSGTANYTATISPAATDTPIGGSFNSSVPSGTANYTATISPAATVYKSGATRHVKAPFLFSLLIFLSFFMLALGHEIRAITPATPPDSLFPKDNDICVKYGFKNPIKKRELEKRVAELGNIAKLEERQISEWVSNLADFAKDRLVEYLGGKAWNKTPGHKRDWFADCTRAEITSAVCSAAIGLALPSVTRIAVLGELVPACMAVTNGFAVLDLEPASKIALFLASGTFCNWLVAEALPMIPCFTDLACEKFQDWFPETKCQGSPPADSVTTLPKKNVSPIDYRSGGSLLTNPGKCGTFFNSCDSKKCENGACTKAACVGKTCETFDPCGPGNGCVCGTILDSASGFCVYGPTPCDGLANCTSSAQCGAGEVCIESSCCQRSVCVGPGLCGGSGTSSKRWLNAKRSVEEVDALLRRGWVNATIDSVGVWVL